MARLRCSRKFSSMTKNDLVQAGSSFAHDLEQLVAGVVEVEMLALAAEERRGGAEVAAHRTADRRDDRGGRDPSVGTLRP
jgi:hypothetical protein